MKNSKLRAIIAKEDIINQLMKIFPYDVSVIKLNETLSMINLTSREFETLNKDNEEELVIKGSKDLLTSVFSILMRFSNFGEIVYIEIDFAEAKLYESAVLWKDLDIKIEKYNSSGSVNEVLKSIGVIVASGKDEIDTLNLKKYALKSKEFLPTFNL